MAACPAMQASIATTRTQARAAITGMMKIWQTPIIARTSHRSAFSSLRKNTRHFSPKWPGIETEYHFSSGLSLSLFSARFSRRPFFASFWESDSSPCASSSAVATIGGPP